MRFSFFFLLLPLCACNSPEARLERLRHEFWENFARHDYFEIRTGEETLHLPLPPSDQETESRKEKLTQLQQVAQALENEMLNDTGRRQLAQIKRALQDLAASGQGVLFDPAQCVVAERLRNYAGRQDGPALLEKIPAYYAAVEARWIKPDGRMAAHAVEEAKLTLDLLKEWERSVPESRKETVRQAQNAIKDFIGLCQSALLQ
ncbi:MAG: hypothetical protein SFV22_13170 [Saprospiraceae bacterium]|nr:hypothetical protein [Saprospiraceae bacterium]